jgi:tRNA(Ile)-lysidine synthetase-like protein
VHSAIFWSPPVTLAIDEAMAGFDPVLPLAVAFSGGADSTALLLACAARWPGQVAAIHVHHGLQDAADAFEQQCTALCQRLGVPLVVQRVDARAAPGQSPEDAARIARYQCIEAVALAGIAELAIKSIALAQHADDQVETLLLALSRGAGVAGLASMPAHWRAAGLHWYRPLLQVPGVHVRDWLRARGQDWVEDPSNQNRSTRATASVRNCCLRWRPPSPRFAIPLPAVQRMPLRPASCCRSWRRRTWPRWAARRALPRCNNWVERARPMCCAIGCARRTTPPPALHNCRRCCCSSTPAARAATRSTSRIPWH